MEVRRQDFKSEFEIVYLDERVRLAKTTENGTEFVFLRSEQDFANMLFRELGPPMKVSPGSKLA